MQIKTYLKEIFYPFKQIKINLLLFWFALIMNGLMFPSIQVLLGFAQKNLVNSIEFNNSALIQNVYILAGIIFVFFAFLNPYMEYLKEVVIHDFTRKLRKAVYTHILNLPAQYLDNKHSGDLISRFTNDLNRVPNIYVNSLFHLLLAIFYGLGSIISMVFLCWQLAIFIFVLGIFETWLITKFSQKIRELSTQIQDKIGISNERFINLIQGFRTIKLFSLSHQMLKKYEKENEYILNESINRNNKIILMDAINTIFTSLNLLGVLSVGAIMVKFGYLDLGSVMAFLILQDGVTYMFSNLSTFFPQLQVFLASSQRVFELLAEPIETKNSTKPAENNTSLAIPEKGLYINDLSFSYNSDHTDKNSTISHVTCQIEPGKITAIIGPSGCGKTTLLKILLGLYQVQDGEIYLNGTSYSDYTIHAIRDSFSYVPQFPFLSHDTIEENIRFGNIESDDAVSTAAKAAYAHDFITNMPKGYDTMITEQGTNLSGGEKQRIALARAICKDAKIMILDEATTGLDSESEAYIKNAIDLLVQNKYTVIIVAHRLSTIKNSDHIIMMDQGKIIQQGSYEDLQKQGLFQNDQQGLIPL